MTDTVSEWSIYRKEDKKQLTHLSFHLVELAFSLFISKEENQWAYLAPGAKEWVLFSEKKHKFKDISEPF